jgi:hypothetical protein
MQSGTDKVRSGRRASIDGWRWPLAIAVSGGLAIEAITGVWVYLAGFSRAAQLQVLGHTAVGLVMLVPFAAYQVRHLRTWWRQKVTAEMVLGYGALAAVTLSMSSGLVVMVQAAFGARLSQLWDLIHLVSGLVVAGLLAAHLVTVYVRRQAAARRDPQLAGAQRRFGFGFVGLIAAAALVVAAGALALRAAPAEFPVPDGYTLSKHIEQYDEYRGSPFAPTNARTRSGMMIEPSVLAGSESCGTARCHEQILAEWLPSAHRFAAMNPPFQQVQREFAADREPAETRYCAGCHDPISLFAGAKDIHNLDLSAPGMQEGISCAACHSIAEVDEGGNADYVLQAPRKYLGESSEGWTKWLSDFLIRAYSRQHLVDYDRNILRTPEFCAACHKQFIPEALNRFGFVEGQNQYDEWRKSPWKTDDERTTLECRDCHMRLVPDSTDPARGEGGDLRRSTTDGAHRHHGTVATNSFMPQVLDLPGWEKHAQLTEEWIRGETELPEVGPLWPEGPVAHLEILAPDQASAGEELSLRTVVTNKKVGHNYITGPLDFVRSWVHLTVTDRDGRVLKEWGSIHPQTRQIMDLPDKPHEMNGERDEGTLVLEGNPIDEHGNVLERHELWRKAGGKGKRVIFPQYSDAQTYRLRIPADAAGPLRIEAELNYRRYRQRFLDLVVPEMERESGVYQPTLTQNTATTTVELSAASPP